MATKKHKADTESLVARACHDWKHGEPVPGKPGSKRKEVVPQSQAQAVAIGMSQEREKGK